MIKNSDFVIAQFETGLEATTKAFEIARSGCKNNLNPAPAIEKVPDDLLAVTDMIIPNETETEILTGIEVTDEASMVKAAKALHDQGIKAVLITIGSKGTFYSVNGETGIVPI